MEKTEGRGGYTGFLISFLLFTLLLLACTAAIHVVSVKYIHNGTTYFSKFWEETFSLLYGNQESENSLLTENTANLNTDAPLIIIDAGHGGEDGGTTGVNGVLEKDVNLDISLLLGDILEASGARVIYTRTDDRLLYGDAAKGQHKMYDLKNRLEISRQYPDAVFVSIHMNAFTDARYHGMQVFYSPNNIKSQELAEKICEWNHTYLQSDNTRKTKRASSNIYLLHKNENVSVLVECGFLSNVEEAHNLSDPVYQQKIAAVLCSAIMDYAASGQ